MRIAGTLPTSLVNGNGIRYVIFTQGCGHHCRGCHNPETWDFNGGREITVEELVKDILTHRHIDGITLSGGDPFYQQDECVKLILLLPERLRDIWIYTGFEIEDIKHTKLARLASYIVTGKYNQDLKINSKMYGSSNQRIIKIERDGQYNEDN